MLQNLLSSLCRRISTSCCRSGKYDYLFKVHPSVSEALAEQRPVVALESTIITHGMPYPHNLSTAKEVEAIVRAEGATPATVGILEGVIHVGLSSEELDFLAQSKTALKVSRRDFPYVISKGLSGGTTVSGTMIAAHRVGIPVFVTGGIGGVHRDGENSLDVSADLIELGRTPIAVVSAGVKSILDIGRTLEFLETQGVCVATYGKSKNFPAFFSPQSGFTSPYNVHTAEEAAELIVSTLSLGLQSGLLLAVPITEEHAAAGLQIEGAIQAAVAEARLKGITGKYVTPFILQRVSELTKGQSLQANIALIHNNAKVGSQIACALSEQMKSRQSGLRGSSKTQEEKNHLLKPKPVVIGGVNVDFIAKGATKNLLFGQTNPGSVHQAFGGVGRNIADCLSRLGHKPLFISAIGTDFHSDAVLNYCKHMVSQYEEQLSSASLVVLDGNIPVSTIDYVCSLAKKHSVPVWYEPTDADKAGKPFLSDSWKALSYTSPNLTELCTMNHTLHLPTPEAFPNSLEDVLKCAAALSRPLLEHLQCVVVTLGALGVLVCGDYEAGTVSLQPRKHKPRGRLCAVYFPALAVRSEEIVNVSGAGDSLAGGMMAGILQGKDTDTCVRMGLLAARLSLSSCHPIAPSLTSDAINPDAAYSQPWTKPSYLWMDN
ncbi:uncharacterized protein zgc:136858 isoform X2 [Hoplias malabaricus]|uniref:uncharacterized protein zgc:136858 isoform X2 n=1 Tax=Hoplias malabaricus TaxID=27720 RepID=UPI0034622B3D